MDLTVPTEVADVARVARTAFSRDGRGLTLARRALHGDTTAFAEALGLLETVGLAEVGDSSNDVNVALAAAVMAEEAGRAALPVPAAALLTGRLAGVEDPVHAVEDITAQNQLVDFAVAFPHPYLVAMDGTTVKSKTTTTGTKQQRPLAPFAARIQPTDQRLSVSANMWAWHEVFSAFATVGALGHLLSLCRRHLLERVQFGKPLGRQQSMEFRLVDSAVGQQGLRELALFTLWRLTADQEPTEAALSLRLVHLETLKMVAAHAMQIHGAIGFCFEHDLSVQIQMLQFRRYAPLPLIKTTARLGTLVDRIPTIFS